MRRVLVGCFLVASALSGCGGSEGATTTAAAASSLASTTTTAAAISGPVSFEEASEIVVAELIGDTDPELPVIVFGRSEPLQPGDRVTALEPLPDQEERLIAGVEAETYFFWIDDVAGAYFAHPVRFAFIDSATGDLTVVDDRWPAQLNGEAMWTADEDYWDPGNWVYQSGIPVAEAAPAPNVVLARHRPTPFIVGSLTSTGRSEAILINGWKPGETHAGEMRYDVDAMDGALSALGASTQTFQRLDRRRNRDALAAAFSEARDRLRPGDTLFVFLTGHGAILGDGTAFADGITEDDLQDWLTGFAPCVKIVVQIHACHSGGFLDSMQQVADLTMVSTSEDGFSMADTDGLPSRGRTWKPDPNPTDRGSENTSGMVEGLHQVAADPQRQAEIRERIADTGESFLLAAAGLSFGHAMSVDFAAINGLTRPATRMGNEGAISCDPPIEGDYDCGFTIDTDLGLHGSHIQMPAANPLGFLRLSDELDRFRVGGSPPFVPVEGTIRPENHFTGTGTGVVAGFDDVEVSLDLILTYGSAEGTYEMGTGGRLPGGESITYAVSCTRSDEDPGAGEGVETPQAFYEQFVTAMNTGDVDWPLSRLHPAVLDAYDEATCRAFVERILEPTLEITVTGVGDLITWTYPFTGGSVDVPGAIPVDVEITVGGGPSFTDSTHLVPVDGLLRWFGTCDG